MVVSPRWFSSLPCKAGFSLPDRDYPMPGYRILGFPKPFRFQEACTHASSDTSPAGSSNSNVFSVIDTMV